MKALLIVLVPFICTLLLLVFWRYCTTWKGYMKEDRKFPTLFHVVFLSLASLTPIVGIVIFSVLLAIYAVNRIDGDIKIKPNKFSKFWFDIDE